MFLLIIAILLLVCSLQTSFAGNVTIDDNTTRGGIQHQLDNIAVVDEDTNNKTFLEIKNIDNLTVAKEGNIEIVVRDYKGSVIQSGKVTLKFDNKWSFTVAIKNGTAKFIKTYILAGNNRSLEISYLKDGNNSASSKTTKITVKKGTPKITMNILSNTNSIAITTSVSGVVFNTQKKWHNTLKFYSNNKLKHQKKVPIKVNSYSKGFSVLNYTIKNSNNPITIQSIFNGGSNYYTVSSTSYISKILEDCCS